MKTMGLQEINEQRCTLCLLGFTVGQLNRWMLLIHKTYYEIIKPSGVLLLGFFRGLRFTHKRGRCYG
jgi:hypothetical protein